MVFLNKLIDHKFIVQALAILILNIERQKYPWVDDFDPDTDDGVMVLAVHVE